MLCYPWSDGFVDKQQFASKHGNQNSLSPNTNTSNCFRRARVPKRENICLRPSVTKYFMVRNPRSPKKGREAQPWMCFDHHKLNILGSHLWNAWQPYEARPTSGRACGGSVTTLSRNPLLQAPKYGLTILSLAKR